MLHLQQKSTTFEAGIAHDRDPLFVAEKPMIANNPKDEQHLHSIMQRNSELSIHEILCHSVSMVASVMETALLSGVP